MGTAPDDRADAGAGATLASPAGAADTTASAGAAGTVDLAVARTVDVIAVRWQTEHDPLLSSMQRRLQAARRSIFQSFEALERAVNGLCEDALAQFKTRPDGCDDLVWQGAEWGPAFSVAVANTSTRSRVYAGLSTNATRCQPGDVVAWLVRVYQSHAEAPPQLTTCKLELSWIMPSASAAAAAVQTLAALAAGVVWQCGGSGAGASSEATQCLEGLAVLIDAAVFGSHRLLARLRSALVEHALDPARSSCAERTASGIDGPASNFSCVEGLLVLPVRPRAAPASTALELKLPTNASDPALYRQYTAWQAAVPNTVHSAQGRLDVDGTPVAFFVPLNGSIGVVQDGSDFYNPCVLFDPQLHTAHELGQGAPYCIGRVLNPAWVGPPVVYSIEVNYPGSRERCPSPGTFFVEPSSGRWSGSPTATAIHAVDVVITARFGAGAPVRVRQWRVHVYDPAMAPGGQACGPHGEPDPLSFEAQARGAYNCSCHGGWAGSDCATERKRLPGGPGSGVRAGDGESGGSTDSRGYGIAVAVGVLGTVVVGLALAAWRHWRRGRRPFDFKAELERLQSAGHLHGVTDGTSAVPIELRRAHVTLVQQLGEGQFGTVWKAMLTSSQQVLVAAKLSKVDEADPDGRARSDQELYREAVVMAQLPLHSKIVRLLGVVTVGKPTVLLMTYCEHGNLSEFLKRRAEVPPALEADARLHIARDIAHGMAHVARAGLVHRDLAARNILVDSLYNFKVGDFGMARATSASHRVTSNQQYYRTTDGLIPVRWTAPECFTQMIFSTASDVWSFGVLVIETFTDALPPYPDLPLNEVAAFVQAGGRPEQPPACSNAVFAMLQRCWDPRPASRPQFSELHEFLEPLTCSSVQTAFHPDWNPARGRGGAADVEAGPAGSFGGGGGGVGGCGGGGNADGEGGSGAGSGVRIPAPRTPLREPGRNGYLGSPPNSTIAPVCMAPKSPVGGGAALPNIRTTSYRQSIAPNISDTGHGPAAQDAPLPELPWRLAPGAGGAGPSSNARLSSESVRTVGSTASWQESRPSPSDDGFYSVANQRPSTTSTLGAGAAAQPGPPEPVPELEVELDGPAAVADSAA